MRILKSISLVIAMLLAATIFGWLPDTEPAIVDAQEGDILTSVLVSEAPVLDGLADESVWENAPALEVETRRGINDGNTTISLRSVYTEDTVYFLLEWADPTHSYLRFPWELQEDGTWLQLRDPQDRGGDDNLWYEDKMSLIWNINNSITDFEFDGCFTACHRSSEGDPKPYGNKYTETEGELGDIWHWKSVRNLGQIDDQYLDSTPYSEEKPGAGRHSDPSEGGGYTNNINEDKTAPAFMPAGDFARDGSPGFIVQSEAVEFDASLFEPGDRLPGIIISEITGDRGDISAGWVWEDGVWTLEFSRALETESEFDVQFDDLSAVYYFGIANFDNAQVRHAFAGDPIAFVFEQ